MKMNVIKNACFGLMLAWSFGASSGIAAAQTQNYPNRPVKLIAGYPPGGGTDMQARLVAQKLSEMWGQPVVVENKSGGLGLVSIGAVKESAPNGYTIYIGTSDHLIFAPSMYDNLPFDTRRDFIAVSPVATQPIVVTSRLNVSAKSMKELVALARAKPGDISFASPGNGSMGHLGAELFQSMTGIKLLHIPYKGSAPALNDLLSGQGADITFGSLASVMPHIKAGKLRGLAITIDQRWPTLPDVPTSAQAGFPDLKMATWNGIFLPAGTPPDVVTKLNSALVAILKMPDVQDRLSTLGFQPMSSTPQAFAAFVDADLKKWEKIVKDAGIEKQKMK